MEKTIVFRFKGGPRDGDETRSDRESSIGIPNEVTAYWSQSEKGTVGSQIFVIAMATRDKIQAQSTAGQTPDFPRFHRYDVVRRDLTETEVIVTCEYYSELPFDPNATWQKGSG